MENPIKFFNNYILKKGFDLDYDSFGSVTYDNHYIDCNLGSATWCFYHDWIEKYEYDKNSMTIKVTFKSSSPYGDCTETETFQEYIESTIKKESENSINIIDKKFFELNENSFNSWIKSTKKEIHFLLDNLKTYKEANKFECIKKGLFEVLNHIDNKYPFEQKPKNVHDFVSKWKILIATGEYELLCKELTDYSLSEGDNDLLMQVSRLSKLEKDYKVGILKRNEYDLESNRIINSILSFIQKLHF